jgi:hypothetical protein
MEMPCDDVIYARRHISEKVDYKISCLHLSVMAFELLTIPAMSTEMERVFSRAVERCW